MATHEEVVRQQYLSLLNAFIDAFPGVEPPAPDWWALWIQKYDLSDIRASIATLSNHHLKDRFTTASTGRAISAMLRDAAVRRAMTPPAGKAVQS